MRRKQEPVVPRRQFSWPRFLVTARHVAASSPGGPYARVPYGEWHARRVGSPRTACGRPAVDWHFFWTLDFMEAGRRACPDCAYAVVRMGRESADA
jgi:hypothetical protein